MPNYTLVRHYGWIYLIVNRVDGKVYVGQTRKKNPEHRWLTHKWVARTDYRQGKSYLHSAMHRHGETNFSFTIIGTAASQDELNYLEVLWISAYGSQNPRCGYNLQSGGTNAGMSEAGKELWRLKMTGRFVGERHWNWQGGKSRFICTNCQEVFYAYKATGQRYCSRLCAGLEHKTKGKDCPAWKGGPVFFACLQCGTVYSVNRARAETTSFCSASCSTTYVMNKVHPKAKKYIGYAPTGEVFEFKNITAFCREHDLNVSKAVAVANGRRMYHKGWRFAHQV